MRIMLTARHIEVPEMIKTFLESKLRKIEKYGHKITGLHAILDREKYLYTTELTLFAKGMTLVGRAKHGKDLLTCVERALDKLKSQLERHEAKRMEKNRRAARRFSRSGIGG